MPLICMSAARAADAPPPVPGNCNAPAMSPVMPRDMSPPNSQASANCFAWQQFIVLNWLASTTTCAPDSTVPASRFGTPGDTSPVAWETYKEASEVFQKDARPPTPWCSQQQLPQRMRSALRTASATASATATPAPSSAHGYKNLASVSKINANQALSEFGQAGTGDAWLTAQNGNIALYEMRINQDEFNFIDQNQLYDAARQKPFAMTQGLILPNGTATFEQYGTVGAVELKAAWVELPDPTSWPHFKISKAWVVYPSAPTMPKLVTVGLTGLHIIHKTRNSPQIIWATFEHINNAPSTSDIQNDKFLPWYTFYNRQCDPSTDHYQCYPNAQPPGQSPDNPRLPRAPGDPYSAPIQVVRLNPISDNSADNVAGLNAWVWQYVIDPASPDSVFKNYQLVDVLWANSPVMIPPGAVVPLPAGNPQPSPQTRIVANTTMETYFQTTKNCLFCHQYAAIAKESAPAGKQGLRKRLGVSNADKIRDLLGAHADMETTRVLKASQADAAASLASDYSFLFSDAQTAPVIAPALKKRGMKKPKVGAPAN
ncbi:hypothetical protein [Janthinobacterium agaricidamnosum]|uniref:hypothetical protein n=1 Tax=Janthinobacterium agaricidamnosum TaxID=55508 RepID=UPI001184DC58|nr:hypothetical protein [Janthinobacterium agaricidamnosum]